MALLELEHIEKHYRRGTRHVVALEDVSLSLDPGEMVVVLGGRASGRTSLLRVAAGVDRPDAGIARFAGRDLRDGVRLLGRDIAYCRIEHLPPSPTTVLQQLLSDELARGCRGGAAQERTHRALRRVQAEHTADLAACELSADDEVRVAIARALSCEPRLLLIDEPTLKVDYSARDSILGLLKMLADDGLAVLSTTGEGTGVLGATRVLSLHCGALRGELVPELAPVTDLAQRRHAG